MYAFASSTELEYLAKESRVAVLYDHDIPLEALCECLELATINESFLTSSSSSQISPYLLINARGRPSTPKP